MKTAFMSKHEKSSDVKKRTNIFYTYLIVFASIFLLTMLALGVSLLLLVNAHSLNQQTELLKENSRRVADSISETLIVNDMNSAYSAEKAQLCEMLDTIAACINSDVFVCDGEGKVILCRDQVGMMPYYEASMVCDNHLHYRMEDKIIQSVYENGTSVKRADINGKNCYVVGTVIKAPDYRQNEGERRIIGTVFAIVEEGTTELFLSIIGTFLAIAFSCLVAGFLLIWMTTKKLVTPLQQMSAAAKAFAVGDFSYRVQISSNDELSDLGYAFNEMADALDKLESSRRSFVANVSHELKTPMTSISGFIDGILDGTIPREKQDYYLKIVSDEVRRLSRLVIAMLNMSKIESGDFEMKPKNYNLSEQIIHILLTFEQKIEKKNIEIMGLESLPPYHIWADTDMIYQVLYNLFDNAVKFTNENGYIAVRLKDIGDMIEVSVKNSGLGISAQELSKIFERFYKVDKSRSLDAKGAGLGLYIVKMMVEMHGGRIYARSEQANEAEFIFTLPKQS